MTDDLDRLQAALADRYLLERELGRGGMATSTSRGTSPTGNTMDRAISAPGSPLL